MDPVVFRDDEMRGFKLIVVTDDALYICGLGDFKSKPKRFPLLSIDEIDLDRGSVTIYANTELNTYAEHVYFITKDHRGTNILFIIFLFFHAV